MIFGHYKTQTHAFWVIFGIKIKRMRKNAKKRLRFLKKQLCSENGEKLVRLLNMPDANFQNIVKLAQLSHNECCNFIKKVEILNMPQIDRYELEQKIELLSETDYIHSPADEPNRLIICITASPEHLHELHICLHSILTQKKKPNKIVLWVPNNTLNEDDIKLPKKIISLLKFGIDVIPCKTPNMAGNFLETIKLYPRDIVILASEHIYYSENWVIKLTKAHSLHPDSLIAHTVYTISDDHKSSNSIPISYLPSSRHIPIIDYGLLYAPNLLNSNKIVQLQNLLKDEINSSIILWRSFVENGVKIVCTSSPFDDLLFINPARDYETIKRSLYKIGLDIKNYSEEKFIKQIISDTPIPTIELKYNLIAKRVALNAINLKQKIQVIFILWEPSLWKAESLFAAMEKHPLFSPAFWIQDSPCMAPEIKKKKRNVAIEFATSQNRKFYDCSTIQELREKCAPDYIFAVQPYDNGIPFNIEDLTTELPCLIPYAYYTITAAEVYSGAKVQSFYRYYVESEQIKKDGTPFMKNGGKNLKVSGLPIVEKLLQPTESKAWPSTATNKKKIIWAPHWTINYKGPKLSAILSVSCFLEVAEGMLALAQKYHDKIHISFKPHPRLIHVLCKYEEWGPQKTNEYYKSWANGHNTQIDEGEYNALFQQSDAMIHDCSSFIKEYLLMNKPCLYLVNQKAKADFNKSTKEALACYEKGHSIRDIENFILNIIEERDVLKDKRELFIKGELLPPGKTPVETIIEDILKPC